MMKRLFLLAIALIATLFTSSTTHAQTATPVSDPLGGATTFAKADAATKVTVMLDYTPNTNHIGLYVAQAKGYYKEANLDVQIVPAGDVQVEQLVATDKIEFGVSYQEQMTYARAQNLPLISVAAVVQHNTSGFASLNAKHPLKTPADLAGLQYGAFGFAIEKPMIDLLMKCYNASADTVKFVDVGFAEPFPLMDQGRIDFVWLFYAWDGIRAKQQGIKVDFLMLKDYANCVPDYYTPLLITSEKLVKAKPDVVRAFVQASARGYADAIRTPAEAADLFIRAVPETDAALVKESAAWLADQFQAEAPRWGEQKLEIWQGYAEWLFKNKVLDKQIDAKAAYTNEFLPGK
jgi:ABC-type nitrate/sulfonate/bicarbonate transport system substrate-binding protein